MKRKIIALAGGIGSGKTSVAAILRDLGFAVLDCDKVAMDVSSDAQLIVAISNLLGEDCVINGKLDRRAVREKVFADNDLYKKYCKLFFAKTKSLLLKKISEISGTVFVEIAVFDAFSFDWDEVWLIESDNGRRIARVIARDSVSKQNVLDIMSRQKKIEQFTYKIENSGSLAELKEKVIYTLKKSQLI